MTTLTARASEPLVFQELTAFYTGPLRDALEASDIFYAFGDANTGADFDDMAFDQRGRSAVVELVGHGDLESGRVIAHGRGAAIVEQAVAAYTEQFGAPVTFVVENSAGDEPHVIRTGGPARIAR